VWRGGRFCIQRWCVDGFGSRVCAFYGVPVLCVAIIGLVVFLVVINLGVYGSIFGLWVGPHVFTVGLCFCCSQFWVVGRLICLKLREFVNFWRWWIVFDDDLR